MSGLIVILLIALRIFLYKKPSDEVLITKNDNLERYWRVAHDSIVDKKYIRAEKALLTILQSDERNAVAYNRLGILYARQGQNKEAIECFEIAQSLESNPSNLHNVGLIYYNTGEYSKAELAFQQAIELEDNVATRYIAYAKVEEKLGKIKQSVEALEKAVSIEENPLTLKMLAAAYEKIDQKILARNLYEKADKMIVKQVKPKPPKQPRRVIM